MPLPSDDPIRRCPDIGLAKQALGWEPNAELEEGLLETINYFRELLVIR
jgi:UDP-glucuronate decarboxylase